MPARPRRQPPGTSRQQDAPGPRWGSRPGHAGREHVEFFETIINSVMSGVWVTDADDTIYYTNRAMETIFGLPPEMIIGANFFTGFSDATIQHVAPYYRLAKNTLETVFYDAVPVTTPAGRLSYQAGYLAPIVCAGRYCGMIATTEDVTRRTLLEQQQRQHLQDIEKLVDLRTAALQARNEQLRLQENELRQARDFLERVIEASLDAIVVSDSQGRISMVNQAYCDMHLVSREKLPGKHIAEVLFASPGTYETTVGDTVTIDDEMVRTQYAFLENTLFATGRCTGLKIFDCRSDGRLFPAEVNASLFYNNQQEMIGATTIIRDITERFLWERQLSAMNRDLESIVRERTADLELSRQRLEETNTTLKVLLAKREQDQLHLEKSIRTNLRENISPYLAKLHQECTSTRQLVLLDILRAGLFELSSPFIKNLHTAPEPLSKTEIRIAGLVKNGKSSSEIAQVLGISPKTIQFHRKNIRKKLGLQHSKKNLCTFLQTME